MKIIGILISLIVSAVIFYMTYHVYVQSNSRNETDPLGFVKPLEKARGVQSKIDLAVVQTAIQIYQTQQGAFPKSLEDLVTAGILTETQIKNLNYDPESGKVTRYPE